MNNIKTLLELIQFWFADLKDAQDLSIGYRYLSNIAFEFRIQGFRIQD